MDYVHMCIGTSVLYPSVGVCIRTEQVPSIGVILVRVVGTYILVPDIRGPFGVPNTLQIVMNT